MFAQTPTTFYNPAVDTAAAGIGIGIILIFVVIGLASLIFLVMCILDVNKHSDAAWAASGQAKQTWFILNIVGIFLGCGVGIIIGLIYWFSIRPKVVAAGG